MAYQTGGSYAFVMPEHDTEISAVYKKVAADIRVTPEELAFHVTEERTGNRKSPSIVTEVRNDAGKLIARYINGSLEEGTKVQEVKVEAVVDKNNDVAAVSYTHLLPSVSETSGGGDLGKAFQLSLAPGLFLAAVGPAGLYPGRPGGKKTGRAL